MKLTSFLLFATILSVFGNKTYSQYARLNLDMTDVPIQNVLTAIEDQSDFFFLYSSKMIDVSQKVDIQAESKDVTDVLDDLLSSTEIKYDIEDRQILLIDKETDFVNNTQQNAISGTVTDVNGSPLIGVTVQVKGTTIGTATDVDGKYTLNNLPENNPTLIFSFVGMTLQEVRANGRVMIDITMAEEAIGLNEVVVIGYGTQKKVNLTGAVSSVDSKVLESRPITNIAQGLQGTVSNLNITQSTGTTGGSANFNIRGFESINGGDPLILVNGVPMDINLVNPNDIESISVLKDAASAAIYGARAAYGVILVTTKYGKQSAKPSVSFGMNYGINVPSVKFETFDALERMNYMNTANMIKNGALYSQFNEVNGPMVLAHYYDPSQPAAFPDANNPAIYQMSGNTDWPDLLLRDQMPQQQYSATVSGATDNFDYYTSLNYFNQVGIAKQFDERYERYNFMTNLNYDVTKWAKIGTKISYNSSDKYYPPNNSANHHSETTTAFQWHQWGNWPVYFPNGKYASRGSVPNMVQFHREAGYRKRAINDLWLTGSLTLTPIKNMTFNFDYSTNVNQKEEESYWKRMEMYYVDGSVSGYFPYTNPSQVTKGYYKRSYYSFNTYADYTNKFGKHSIKVMVGFNQENQNYAYFTGKRDKLTVETMPFMDLAYGERYVTDGASHYAIRGSFSRLNYNFDDRYLFEFNGRYDGTSKFPKADRFAFFPSASVGWRLDNEPFLAGLENLFDVFKVRASYGSLGNQSVTGNYPYIATFSSGQAAYLIDGEKPMTLYAPGLVSPTLTWETVTQMDLGVDIAMLENRFNLSFDLYQRDTKDMLTRSATLPAVLAVSEPSENAADLRTKGWDLSVGWRQTIAGDINWEVKFLLSDYTSEITRYSNPSGLLSDYYVGQTIGNIWGFETAGIAQTDAEANALDQTNVANRTRGAGDLVFIDQNGDGKITYGKGTLDDHGDRKIIGNNTPRYSYGLNSNFTWKEFDLNIFFQGIAKRDYWLSNTFWIGGFNDEWRAHNKLLTDYWSPDNTDAFFPRPIITGGRDVTAVQTRFLQNAAYLRLKELTLGYTLPANLSQKLRIDRLRVYFSGNNIWEVTGIYKHKSLADPEMVAAYQTPINRTYSIGANIYF